MKKYSEEYQCPLLIETMALLNKCNLTVLAIHGQTNLPYHWLNSLKKGKTAAPNVNRIQFLHQFLSEHGRNI